MVGSRTGGDAAGESCGSPRQCALFGPTLADAVRALIAQVRDEVGDTQKLRRFVAFHAENPRIYQLVEAFALHAAARRTHRYGIKMVWERVRWEVMVETVAVGDDFKVNNDYHALYSRLFLAHHPEHAGLFELRRLHPEGRRHAA